MVVNNADNPGGIILIVIGVGTIIGAIIAAVKCYLKRSKEIAPAEAAKEALTTFVSKVKDIKLGEPSNQSKSKVNKKGNPSVHRSSVKGSR